MKKTTRKWAVAGIAALAAGALRSSTRSIVGVTSSAEPKIRAASSDQYIAPSGALKLKLPVLLMRCVPAKKASLRRSACSRASNALVVLCPRSARKAVMPMASRPTIMRPAAAPENTTVCVNR